MNEVNCTSRHNGGAMRSAYCTLPISRKGRGMVTADDYAALIAPTFILHPTALPHGEGDGYRGRLRFANRPYVKVATAPDCRYQIAPLTIDHEKGANRRR